MKKRFFQSFIVTIASLICFIAIIIPASASSKEIVVTDRGLSVNEHQHIENVIVFGHNATIAGKADSVILVNGNLKIAHTASIKDLVLVVGGNITEEKGAHVTSNLISFKWNNQVVSMLLVALIALASSWLFKFFFSILLVIIGYLVAISLREKLDATQQFIKQINWKLLVIGLATSLIILALVLILSITVVGIPIAILILLPVVYFFFETVASLSIYLGNKLLPDVEAHWLIALVGVSLVASVINFPLFGFVVLICIHWVSLSLMVLRLRSKFIKKPS